MRLIMRFLVTWLVLVLVLPGCARVDEQPYYDLIIRDGTVYDGNGGVPFQADIGVTGDRIVTIGDLRSANAATEIEAEGLAVAPGFINVLSWAMGSLLVDGRSQSDIRQGVTLEVFGEGRSMGPLNEAMKEDMRKELAGAVPVNWTGFGEGLERMVEKGVSTNVASFVGATTVRVHELGYEDRAPNRDEFSRMQELVRIAMEEGALGVGSALIYAPAFYADTDELIGLARIAGEYGGIYISHLRSEANEFEQAVDELMTIAREADIPAEIYHLKAAGEANWPKLDAVIDKINNARASGQRITANMYTYTAGATGLDAMMPPWVQEGGMGAFIERLKDPSIRARVKQEIATSTEGWENMYSIAGSAERILLIGFENPALRPLTGKTLAEVAAMRGTSPEETAMDLIIEDESRVFTAYFLMSPDNIPKKIALPWMSFGSDERSSPVEEPFTLYNAHPRAYGNVARLLGRYVRDEQVISLEEAIRKLTSLPADNLSIRERGRLETRYYADIVVFDPATIQDHATYDDPHHYATGVNHVFVNGTQVLADGEHTGALPGQVVRGPGWLGWENNEQP